jgi:hypothetical protein
MEVELNYGREGNWAAFVIKADYREQQEKKQSYAIVAAKMKFESRAWIGIE